jgi:hypothetical protein
VHRKIKLLANPLLFFGGVFYVIISVGICIVIIISLNDPANTAGRTDQIEAQMIFGGLGIGMIVAGLLCFPRWFVTITLDVTTIRYHAAFKKPIVKDYSNYPFIYRGWYRHRGLLPVGYNAEYIVLASRKMTTDEVQHINQIGISDKIIKIRYRKKAYHTLCNIFPDRHRIQLERCFKRTQVI